MAILKCKMCGGDLNVTEGVSVYECEYCGTKQTVPVANDEKKLTLFARANRLRFNNEFDKAAGVYEAIVADFPEEAEAYWGLVLCQYGIEYVDDPKTGKKIPTCHRSSFESVMEDGNFELTLEYADVTAREVYRAEAKQIEELRRGIIAVSAKEEPYDIFICYKETDDKGERTIDSVIAQDVYTALTDKGYRVFFARISLEDKLGVEYEPYIFAALHSAKVMLVFGTDYEYYNAVWVKNEWSRFLQLIEKGEKKTLIPCYKGIDAYDMPREFAKLQAQDMGKVGAMQDLLRGIEKILGADKAMVKETVVMGGNAQVAPLLKRAFMYLEDGVWTSANEYCEKVLDIDPECAEAYLGKLLATLKMKNRQEMRKRANTFAGVELTLYQKAVRFGDEAFKAEMNSDLLCIAERVHAADYQRATQRMANAITSAEYRCIAAEFRKLADYKDAARLMQECLDKATAWEKKEQLAKEQKKRRNRWIKLVMIVLAPLMLNFIFVPLVGYLHGDYDFYINIYNAKKFTVPAIVTDVKWDRFEFCDTLESVTISEGVERIEGSPFRGCPNLREITIPASVRSISKNAFNHCDNLTDIYYAGTVEEWKLLYLSHSDTVTIHCSNGKCGNVVIV